MKLIVVSIVLFFGFTTNGQTPCTVILKDRSVIEAFHLGSTANCKKGRKQTNTFEQAFVMCGKVNGESIIIDNFETIEEIRINSYKSLSSSNGDYALSITVKYRNGDKDDILNARLECIYKNTALRQIPIQISQNNIDYQEIAVDVRNIETLIF